MKINGKLAIRIPPNNPNHHLWNNNGTYWCHFTEHLADFTKRRSRLSLQTNDLCLARERRDRLISSSLHRGTKRRLVVKLRSLVGLAAILLLTLSSGSAQPIAGQFQWPFLPRDSYRREQWQFEFNGIGNNKYHAGEDWNRGSGQDDYGDALYALADGIVAFVDKQGVGVPSIGKVVLLRYTLPDGGQLDDLRIHCAEVLVDKYDQDGKLTKVVKGQKVATIGGKPSHLHWELHNDLNFWWYTNPYYTSVTPERVVKYLNPSLFVDDRARGQSVTLGAGWNYFRVQANAASSSAFVERGETRLSLKRAVDAGWIYGRVFVNINSVWYYYPDPEQVFFESALEYAVYGYRTGTLNVFYPGHNFKADRAHRDIVQTAFDDVRFRNAEIHTESYGENLGWSADWELRFLSLSADGKQTAFYQACRRENPLARYVGFIDPDTGAFSGWQKIPSNRLQ